MKTQEKNKYKYVIVPKRSKNINKYKKNWNGIPAFIKKYDSENSLYNHLLLSILNHIVFFLLLWGIFSILKIYFVNPIFKPKEKITDIEFVITNQKKYKSKLTEIKSDKDLSSTLIEKKSLSTQPLNKNKTNSTKTPAGKSFKSIPVAVPDDFSIPVPKSKSASSKSNGLGRLGSNSAGNSSNDFHPGDIGGDDAYSGNAGSSKGTGFDKNATRKVITTYDISPYVNELKRNVRMNWKPPKNSESKYVELFLRIAKDGRLIILNVKRTSEVAEVDEAALNAVRKSQPLAPLPSKYGKGFLDLIFTFDSSSVGSRY